MLNEFQKRAPIHLATNEEARSLCTLHRGMCLRHADAESRRNAFVGPVVPGDERNADRDKEILGLQHAFTVAFAIRELRIVRRCATIRPRPMRSGPSQTSLGDSNRAKCASGLDDARNGGCQRRRPHGR